MNDFELRQIFKDIFLISDESQIDSASLEGTAGWDSFSHMRLIIEVEERFNIGPIPPTVIAKLTSFGAFSVYLNSIDRESTP